VNIEKSIRRAIGPERLGRFDYLFRPGLRDSWGGPFNGQERRRELVLALLKALPLEAIVETGTYRGTTTRFLAEQSQIRVYSVEHKPRYHYFAVRHLAPFPKAKLSLGDSRKFLARLEADPEVPKKNVFFYLDAHWGGDLPLRAELEQVFTGWSDTLVMIDDFQVPGRDFGYDDYGPDRALNLAYLKPLAGLGLQAFFPACTPAEETGARRGCVVLCRDGEVAERLDRLPELVRHRAESD